MKDLKDDIILCIDKGTSELKTVLFNCNGKIISQVKSECKLLLPRQDWIEADLGGEWKQVVESIKSLMRSSGIDKDRIKCIGITSYMSGTIFIDAAGETIGNAVLWNDSRTNELAEEWESKDVISKAFKISGSRNLPGWTIPLVAWWKKNDPETLRNAKYVLSMKDWIRFKLTGEVFTDHTEATCAPGDILKKDFSEEIFRLYGVEDYMHLFPPVREPHDTAGALIPSVARELGLNAKTKVVVGMGDMPVSILGAGAIDKGYGASALGTTFLNGIVIDKPLSVPENIGMTLTYIDNKLVRLVNNTGGGTINYQWLLNNCRSGGKDQDINDLLSDLNNKVNNCPAGANGVMYHPYINPAGMIAPFFCLEARAQFTGIGLHNTFDDLGRAVYEGLGFAMRDCYSSVPIEIKGISLTGGGSKSGVLCGILADCCGVSINIPEITESAALGTAIVAAVGSGMYNTYREAVANMVRNKCVYEPDVHNMTLYNELFEKYKEIRTAMMPVWKKRGRT